jgi:hypothetical protein
MKGEEQMNIEAKLTQLKQKLDNLADKSKTVQFQITESFTRDSTYNVTNLNFEAEDGCLYFYGEENLPDNCVLNGFSLDSLSADGVQITKNKINLVFMCGGHINISIN